MIFSLKLTVFRWFSYCVNLWNRLVEFPFPAGLWAQRRLDVIHVWFQERLSRVCFLTITEATAAVRLSSCLSLSVSSTSHFLFYLAEKAIWNIYGKNLYRYIKYETLKVTSCNSGCKSLVQVFRKPIPQNSCETVLLAG